MLADALEEVGIPRGDYVVRVNNRKVLNGVMEVAGVLDPMTLEVRAERGIVLRAIDKFDKVGRAGRASLCSTARASRGTSSGDFIDGVGDRSIQQAWRSRQYRNSEVCSCRLPEREK